MATRTKASPPTAADLATAADAAEAAHLQYNGDDEQALAALEASAKLARRKATAAAEAEATAVAAQIKSDRLRTALALAADPDLTGESLRAAEVELHGQILSAMAQHQTVLERLEQTQRVARTVAAGAGLPGTAKWKADHQHTTDEGQRVADERYSLALAGTPEEDFPPMPLYLPGETVAPASVTRDGVRVLGSPVNSSDGTTLERTNATVAAILAGTFTPAPIATGVADSVPAEQAAEARVIAAAAIGATEVHAFDSLDWIAATDGELTGAWLRVDEYTAKDGGFRVRGHLVLVGDVAGWPVGTNFQTRVGTGLHQGFGTTEALGDIAFSRVVLDGDTLTVHGTHMAAVAA